MTSQTIPHRFFIIAGTVIIWLSFAIRLNNLGGDSLWLDEILTANVIRSGQMLSVQDHPPLLYILVNTSVHLFEENEFFLRLPSALASILAIPLLIKFGYFLKYPAAGLWTALFLTFLPFHLHYAQEARHYSLLLTISLATYVALWLALQRQKTRFWVAYTLITTANLYTHYGALIVLASQSLLIGGWLVGQLWKKQYQNVRKALLCAAFVLLLYLPWLPRLQSALMRNLGDDAAQSTGFTSLSTWLKAGFFAFGFNSFGLSYLIGILFAIGFIIIIWQKKWMILAFLITGLVLPFLLIQLFHVSRWAFPKYVIYILPFYLLCAAIAVDFLVRLIQRNVFKASAKGYVYTALLVVVGFAFVAFPLLLDEYAYVERDWRSVAHRLGQQADENDIILAFTLDLKSGFDQVGIALPYYLHRELSDFSLLSANHLHSNELQNLVHSNAKVWAVVFNRVIPIVVNDESGLNIESFRGSVYLLDNPQQDETFAETIALYEQIIPLTVSPAPQCLLKRDLALLYVIDKDFLVAKQWYEDAQTQCPAQLAPKYAGQDLAKNIYQGLIRKYESQGQHDQAVQAAARLMQIDSKNEVALKTLTVFDFLEAFGSDALMLWADQAAEPVQIQKFIMPQNGDWGDVLLLHPPASISYEIELPMEPTTFRSRIAMLPDSWYWGGDGSEFVVQIHTKDSLEKEVFRKYVSNHQKDQRWHDVVVPLTQFSGQVITITLITEPGPSGDFTGDWAGWETPRIIYDTK